MVTHKMDPVTIWHRLIIDREMNGPISKQQLELLAMTDDVELSKAIRQSSVSSWDLRNDLLLRFWWNSMEQAQKVMLYDRNWKGDECVNWKGNESGMVMFRKCPLCGHLFSDPYNESASSFSTFHLRSNYPNNRARCLGPQKHRIADIRHFYHVDSGDEYTQEKHQEFAETARDLVSGVATSLGASTRRINTKHTYTATKIDMEWTI